MIHQFLDNLKDIDNWDEVRTRFGEMINLSGPAPTVVVNRAFADNKFAFYLMMTRESPGLQQQLLNDPRNLEFEEKDADKDFSNSELLVKASGAMLKWAKAGFTKVDDATYKKRMDACTGCPHLKQPSAKAVYKITGSKQSICGLCGCVASRKAKLPTESCPSEHPVNVSMTRWGEPLQKVKAEA